MTTRLPVAVEMVGADTDLWCRTCNLSTGFRVWYTTRVSAVEGGELVLRWQAGCTEATVARPHVVEVED